MILTPNILVIEDHEVVILAIRVVVTENFHKAVLTKSNNFIKALSLIEQGNRYDLVILDIDVPGGDSYRMIEALRKKQPGVRVLVFSGHEEKKHALRFMSAGANGFLSKNAPLEDLGTAIRMILADRRYISAEVQQLITDEYLYNGKQQPTERIQESLSPREQEVLDFILLGKSSKDIAAELKLNVTTVSTHKARIFQKLGVTNLLELFKKVQDEA